MKKNKLGAVVASAVLMTSAGAPMAMAADSGHQRAAPLSAGAGDAAGGSYRFVVKYRAGTRELRDAASANQGISAATARAGLNRIVRATARSAALPAVQATLLRRMASPGWAVIKASRFLDAGESADFIREMKANPAVESVEIDYLFQHMGIRPASYMPDDPESANKQWNFYNPDSGVNASEAWDISQGEGVVVAVLDSGVVQNTPDLQNNLVPGYDMITDKRVSRRDNDGRVAGGWDTGSWVETNYCTGWATKETHPAEDSLWHGSHVAGTIAQETNNGQYVAGLAFKAKVLPVRVLGSCGGTGSDIADGMIWAAGGEVPGMPINPNPADVINLSLGSKEPLGCPAVYQAAINQVVRMGVIVVTAAGNSNGNAAAYTMGSCNNVISVGATGFDGGRVAYSNYGPRVELAAPGGAGGSADTDWIHQVVNTGKTVPGNEFVVRGMAGTSMSAPHVAAAAAMIQSVVQTPLTWVQMRTLLASTVKPFKVAPPANKSIGAGILDIKAALDKALLPPCDPAVGDCSASATPLVNNVAVAGLLGRAGDEVLYSFQAEAGKVLSINSYGGAGEVSMYAGLDKEPSAAAFDARSERRGTTTQVIRFTAPKAGTYYIKLVGVTAYTGVSVVARQ